MATRNSGTGTKDAAVTISLEGDPDLVRALWDKIRNDPDMRPALVASGGIIGESRRTEGAASMRYTTLIYHV